MAKLNVESIRFRPNTTDENYTVLQEIRNRKEVDARKQDELNLLFDCINAECASKSLKEKRKALISPDKQEKFTKAVHYGPIPGFPSGTWWGIRMDCSRDFVHEPFNEDIHDGPFGAVSICTSHLNTHNDIDLGDILTFTTQKYSKTNQSKDSLTLSYKNRVPIRLIRSYCLSNSYAPKTGYRYDGLYTVVDHWIGVSSDTTKHHKFVLIRVLDQECPSWSEKSTSKVLKTKKSISPRLTRSHVNTNSQEPKTTKFVYNKIQKESKVANVSAIVSRQVFKKFVPDCPDNSPKSASTVDSTNQSSCQNTCVTKLCNTNLSIRTNLYDSSHKLQEVKKGAPMTFCRILKSNQASQLLQKNSQIETEKMSAETSDTEVIEKINSNDNSANACIEKKIKKVTWADSCNSTSNSIEKPIPTTGNGFKYSGSGVVDGFSPTSPKNCVLNYNIPEHLSPIRNSKSNNLLTPSTKSHHHIVQVHSRPNAPQTSKASFSTVCDSFHETERFNSTSSLDSLAPDKLVSVIVKEKYHPMAKLLIGNMIGLENQESSILNAYNTLTSKVDQEDSIKKSKENKIRNKFYIRNKSRKNAVMKKQRREITNLIIDAKFDTGTRGSRNRRLRSLKRRISKSEMSQRKLMNPRRIQSRNTIVNKEIRNTVRKLQSKTIEKSKTEEAIITKQPKMVSAWTQCTLLKVPSVDQSSQIGDTCIEETMSETDIKVELVDLDEIKSEPCDTESNSEEIPSEPLTKRIEKRYFSGSAFAPVNTVNSSHRITQLRSIGFIPISTCSPSEDNNWNQDSMRPDVSEEYNKYTSEENNIVGYMDEQLHFEDIEEEDESMDAMEESVILHKITDTESKIEVSPETTETLSDYDFDKPWHGWRKISMNGEIHWTGY